MEWRTEAKTRQEMIDLIKNQPEEYLWALVFDGNEEGDRITPAVVGMFIFPYSHLCHDICRRENFFFENRFKFKRVTEGTDKFLRKVQP